MTVFLSLACVPSHSRCPTLVAFVRVYEMCDASFVLHRSLPDYAILSIFVVHRIYSTRIALFQT